MPEAPLQRKDSRAFSALCEEVLKRGLNVRFQASGRSMLPNISDGDALIVAPPIAAGARRGQIAFTHGPDGLRAHRVVSQTSAGKVITRGDAGLANDRGEHVIVGKVISIERGRKSASAAGTQARVTHGLRKAAHQAWGFARRRASAPFAGAILLTLLFLLGSSPAYAAAGMTVTLTSPATNTFVTVGSNVTFAVTVKNSGTTTLANASITMGTIANMTFVSATQLGGTGTWVCTVGTSCTLASFPNTGTAPTFNFVYKVNASPTAATTTATAQGSANAGAVTSNSATITLNITTTLTVTNTGAPNPIAAGSNVTYSVGLANSSGVPAGATVTVTMADPTNETYVSSAYVSGSGTWTCAHATGTITCTDTAAPYVTGSSTTFSFVYTVNTGTAGGPITSTANAQAVNTASPGTASFVTAVQMAAMTVTNTGAPNPVAPADVVTYTVGVTNSTGGTAVANETVTMALPAHTAFSSAAQTGGTGTWTCSFVSPTVTCTDPANFPNGSSTTFNIAFTVTAGTAAGTSITGVANAQAFNTTASGTASSSVTVQIPALTLTNSAATPVAPGGPLTYTINLSNSSGTNAVANETVSMPDPANTTYFSAAATSGTGTWICANAAGTVTCTDTANYPTGGATTFAFVFLVNNAVANGTVLPAVTAMAAASNTTSNATAASNTVTVQTPDISVTDTPNPTSQAATGGTIVYTQVITNNGTAPAAGASFTEPTPTNTTFTSAAPPANWTCGTLPAGGGTGTITCTANSGITIAAAGTATLTVTVTVNSGANVAGTTISNTVTVSESGNETNLSNNVNTATVTVAAADLAMTQTVSPAAVAPGSTITYTETVTNNGLSAASNVDLYQQTPPNTTFASITFPTGWACATPTAGNTGQVLCTVASLASNTTTTNFVFTVTVNSGASAPAAGTTIQNYADVTSTTADPKPSNNSTQTTTLVETTGDADLAITGGASPTPVFVSSTLIYTLQVTNYGLAPTTATTVTDTLPSTVTYVSSSSTQGTCTDVGAIVTCVLGAVAYAPSSPITITITVTTPAAAQTLTNTATFSATAPTDPVSSNNTASVITVVQPLVCASPGRDGAGGTLSGVVNAYYPPSTAGTVAAGSISIALGPAAANGAQKAIAAGDLLLIIQMQAAQINSTDTSSYGSGVPGTPAGSTSLGSSGEFEFVTATSAVPVTGGTLTFLGTGITLTGNPNPGFLNSYSESVATSASGQTTFQVIRVPQYTSATLSSGLTAMPWNGATGGILSLDVASQLTLGGTVALDGLGFRGGGGIDLTGSPTGTSSDTVTTSPAALPALPPPANSGANASKGEGIAGTPHWIAPALGTITNTTVSVSTGQTYVEGLPNGSFARGAPGNAGGGSTDAHPVSNDQNAGGGAGGNGGAGGIGGFGWSSAGLVGGYGGLGFPASTSALIMGGGGGAGTNNDGAYWNPLTNSGGADCGTGCTGIYSSGAAGGGIVIIRAGTVTGTGTITSNGQTALQLENDGGGGGGAGGAILVFSNSGGLSGLTVSAVGGGGGDTWPEQTPGTPFPGNRHGPGGGGGGGVVFLTGTPTALTVLGGNPGYSTLADDSYGATPGGNGISNAGLTITQTPGTQSGAYCAGADLAVTNTPNATIIVPPITITYTQTVTNAGPNDALNAVFSEAIPANTTFVSLVSSGADASGWTCTTTGSIYCTNPDVPSGASGTTTFTVVVSVPSGTTLGTQIVDTDTVTSGTNDPNLANNSATASVLVAAANTANLSLTQTATPNPVAAGGTITYTISIINNGPSTAYNVQYSEVIPQIPTPGLPPYYETFNSLTCAASWTCTTPAVNSTGTVTGSIASVANGATATFTLILNTNSGTPSGTIISETASVSASTTDPEPETNMATNNVVVAGSGQYDLFVTDAASPSQVLPGNNITYTQTLGNSGPSAASSVVFTGSVPANSTLVSFGIPTGWICNSLPSAGGAGAISCCPGAGTTCSGANVNSGTTVSFPMVVKVPLGTAPQTITNTVSVAPTTNDVTTTNNTATASTLVVSPTQANVTITKTASPQPVDQGTNLTYTIQLVNNGPAVAQGVSVSDPLPSQVTYSSVSSTAGTCIQSGGSVGGTVNCTIGSMSVGSEVTITIDVVASTFSSTTYATNTATLTTTTSNPNPATCPTIPVTICSSVTSTIEAATAVQLSDFHAQLQPQGGVLIQWHTKEEVRNLGFHLYRDDATGHHRLDPSLIAGAALELRGALPRHGAKTYNWIDPTGDAQSTYTVEDVDLNGTRTLHGPVQPDAASSFDTPAAAVQVARASLLTELNHVSAASASMAVKPNQFGAVTPRPIIWQTPNEPAAPQSPDAVSNTTLNGEAAVKISVSHTGWYRVTGAQLYAAGLSPRAEARMLQLYAEGVEQPIIVNIAVGGSLSPQGSIEFYGTGIDTPFSAERVYWLAEGNRPGLRVAQVEAPTSTAPTAGDFSATAVLQQRTTYFAALLNGENNDNFFGALVTSEPVDQPLTAPHADPSSSIPVSIDVTLQGGTDQQAHSVSVTFNGTYVGEMDFANLSNVTNTFAIESSLLQQGTNTVTLTALNGDNDVSLVQSIGLHYPHSYTADSNWLNATAQPDSPLHIGGFTNPQIAVFDITNPLAITQLLGRVTLDASGTYGISVETAGQYGAQRTLIAFSSDQIAAPDALTHHAPNHLDEAQYGAAYLVITHSDFAASVAPLVSLHESEGQRSQVVSIDDIFDAFNYGERSPFAIRSFLQLASTRWGTKPQAVLLMGDASLDPRNYLGFGDLDFVPTRMIETQAFKTSSDDWLTDFNQTGFATIPTGRIPADTPQEAELAVSRIVNFERGALGGAWEQQATFIADQNLGDNFSAAAQTASTVAPSSLNVSKIFTDGEDPSVAQQQIVTAINSGSLIVDYSGHGAEDQWSFNDIFDSTTIPSLTNVNTPSVFLLMDCLNGFFQDVYATSLAEDLLFAPNGGAVAVWASSGFTVEPPQATMNQALLSNLTANPSIGLGQAILQAKLGISDPDVRRTWILFGDPAMRVPLPTPKPARK
jgi:uncharacterized repeat protein (TIGR01451 family)